MRYLLDNDPVYGRVTGCRKIVALSLMFTVRKWESERERVSEGERERRFKSSAVNVQQTQNVSVIENVDGPALALAVVN